MYCRAVFSRHSFDPPIEVQVGDTIQHTCRFQSRDRTDWTYRGQAATDEMCHIYFVHYPAQNLTECFNNGAVSGRRHAQMTCKFLLIKLQLQTLNINVIEISSHR